MIEKKYDEKLSCEVYCRIAEEIRRWGTKPWVTLWGGEPTMHPDFDNIYKAFLEASGLVAVCTNGTMIDRHLTLFELEKSKTFWLFSIDGLENKHDQIRGEGNFETTIQNLEKSISIRNKAGTNHIFGVEITITKINLDEIPLLCKLLVNLGADIIIINHLWYLTHEISEKYGHELQKVESFKVGTELSSKGYLTDREDLPNPEKVNHCIEESKKVINNDAIFFAMPDYDYQGIINHYNVEQQWKSKFSCYKNLVKFDFDTIGNVTPCKPFPDFSYGNIEGSTLLEIWNHKKRKQIHDIVINNNGFSVCNMCPDKALSLPFMNNIFG